MITIDRLTFSYPEQALLFENFTLKVKRGETWAVIGPSGCGKTTLLYLLARLLKPISGSIELAGDVLKRLYEA